MLGTQKKAPRRQSKGPEAWRPPRSVGGQQKGRRRARRSPAAGVRRTCRPIREQGSRRAECAQGANADREPVVGADRNPGQSEACRRIAGKANRGAGNVGIRGDRVGIRCDVRSDNCLYEVAFKTKRFSARALMETFAVMAESERRAERFLNEENLGGLDALAQNVIYASRDPYWVKDSRQTRAVSVLAYIDKFDKRCEGFRGHYDVLSERCDPNSLGHNFMFSELDRTDGTVRYYDEREPARNSQMIVAALAPLPVVESMMARLDALIEKVSELHHRIAPLGGVQQEPPRS
jgi:hypothetical protein